MRISIVILIANAVLAAQNSPHFEVASIHPSNELYMKRAPSVDGQIFRASAVTLWDLILQSHHADFWAVLPPFSDHSTFPQLFDRYDVQATLPPGSKADLSAAMDMLRSLLYERFELQTHHEQRMTNTVML